MTTTATPIYTIPADGLTAVIGDVEIHAFQTPQAGCLVQVRIDGRIVRDLCSGHNLQSQAIAAYRALVERFEAEAAPTKLQPAASGTQTKVSDPGHTVLAVAALNGIVHRGGQPGEATVIQLKALAKRGYLTLVHETGRDDLRKVVIGGRITRAGRIRLAELTADERESAATAAKLAHVLTHVAA